MELYNKEKKKAEVSMRKKGWKDNEDSSLEKYMEIQKANKRVRKDMDALISVSRMFKYDMKVMVGKAVYMFKIFEDWIKRDNAASYISEKARDDDGRVVIQAVGIETTDPVLAFPCMMPTFILILSPETTHPWVCGGRAFFYKKIKNILFFYFLLKNSSY